MGIIGVVLFLWLAYTILSGGATLLGKMLMPIQEALEETAVSFFMSHGTTFKQARAIFRVIEIIAIAMILSIIF